MSDVGSPLSYYLRAMGSFIGYWNLLAIFSILSGIFLLFLAYLILRANPQKTKNRFMALMLVTEAIRCFTAMLFWLYAWPEEALVFLKPARVAYYTMSLQLFILYMVAATFYSNKKWAKQISGFFKLHGLYILPIFCLSVILIASHLLGGTNVAIGDISWIYCESVGPGQGSTYSGDPLPFEPECSEEFKSVYPMTFTNVFIGPLGRILLFIPLIGAIVAAVATTRSKNRILNTDDSNLLGEVKAVRLGFIGKTVLQVTTILILFWMISFIGGPPTLETNPFNPNIELTTALYVLPPLGTSSTVFAALFEGIIFTYAVVKNDMFGIDERLRKTFTTTIFAGLGAFLFLLSTELMESVFNQGWLGGVFIGLIFIMMRKPILSTLGIFSSKMIPISHTEKELIYLEMFSLAVKDGGITAKERSMLDLQAKILDISPEKVSELEQNINLQLGLHESE